MKKPVANRVNYSSVKHIENILLERATTTNRLSPWSKVYISSHYKVFPNIKHYSSKGNLFLLIVGQKEEEKPKKIFNFPLTLNGVAHSTTESSTTVVPKTYIWLPRIQIRKVFGTEWKKLMSWLYTSWNIPINKLVYWGHHVSIKYYKCFVCASLLNLPEI